MPRHGQPTLAAQSMILTTFSAKTSPRLPQDVDPLLAGADLALGHGDGGLSVGRGVALAWGSRTGRATRAGTDGFGHFSLVCLLSRDYMLAPTLEFRPRLVAAPHLAQPA